ncbi:acetamidase [Neofusicoccum parvum]|uniref:Acetamidase n=1 Tax=Neofusicoccum parvum TaxID=310453 RepID=A0ACB5RP76_9PEZI|nr:acetamidase [Neofusicoccum parvum]
MGSTEKPSWLAKAEHKRALQAAAIDAFLSEHPPDAQEQLIQSITEIDDIEELLTRISTRAVSAADVAVAYIQSLTEVLFDDAVRRAKELDEHLAATGKPIGPLHGLPVTLKDQFDIKGYDSTIGQMGAIIVAKTNLPQSIMWCETENPLWGLTTNPRNPAFTPGGSTGGESALLAEHGSIVGWGTDIGGSIRIPSHMLGLYGLKPSSGRLPYQNVTVSTDGQEHVPSVIGPLARSLSSLRFVTKAVVDAAPWDYDPKVVPLPWRADVEEQIQSRSLVIGLLVDDGVVKVHPPVERVVKEAAPKDQFYTADGGEDIRREVLAGGEPYIPHVEALVNRGQPISVYEYWQLNKLKHEQQKRYVDKWNTVRSPSGRKVDLLLTPVMPHPAVPHRGCRWVGYTKVWNFLDYSAVVLPGGAVDKSLDAKVDYAPRNELDKWNWNLYDPESMDGMPVGVQIVGRKLEEEKVLGAAKVVEAVLKGQ